MAVDSTPNEQRAELATQRRRVHFDTYDVTVDELLRRLARRRIDIAPVYQRRFRWDRERQSRLIESIFLGIPIPPLFMATNRERGSPESVGSCRRAATVATLAAFAGDSEVFEASNLDERGRSAYSRFDGEDSKLRRITFADLSEDVRTAFEDRPVGVGVLNDKRSASTL